MRVHRLIWETFNGEIPYDLTIDHIDTNKANNSLYNLRLLTRNQNSSIAHKGLESKRKALYLFNGIKYDRETLQKMFNFSRKFWYNKKNKINDTDFIFCNNIFKRIK